MPRLLAVLLIAAALLLMVQKSRPARALDLSDARITAVIVLLLGAATFALERAGYRATVFVFLLVVLAAVERRPPWLSILLSGGFALGSFYLINTVLRVPLPVSRWGW